ncbi:MAG: hypothetical protein LAP38_00360 [Acidobacteriia bacterium]|nr:hypothetical protein [Terriglobia bacterium]
MLLIVGSVNANRIATFKRTRKYSRSDYELLLDVIHPFQPLYTVAHVMAEVSNLTDLNGPERIRARDVQRQMLTILTEPEMASARAAGNLNYQALGLVDAAIASVAQEYQCAVLTDDLDLYLALQREGIDAYNFTHVQAQAWGL